jgi:hypothetical protein
MTTSPCAANRWPSKMATQRAHIWWQPHFVLCDDSIASEQKTKHTGGGPAVRLIIFALLNPVCHNISN